MEEKAKKDIAHVETMIRQIRFQSYRHGIDPSLFLLALQCLCRAPLCSGRKMEEFISIISHLAEAGMNYPLLLKAGILTGQFPDYQHYKRQRAARKQQSNEMERTHAELAEMQKKIHGCDSRISEGRMTVGFDARPFFQLRHIYLSADTGEDKRIRYRKAWKHLTLADKQTAALLAPEQWEPGDFENYEASWIRTLSAFQKKEGEKVWTALAPDAEIWEYEYLPVSEIQGPAIVIGKKTAAPGARMVKKREENTFGGQEYLFFDGGNENEAFAFVSIFQKTVWDFDSLYGVSGLLKRYFCLKHHGRSPDENELSALRQRYYRFIQRAYPSPMQQLALLNDAQKLPEYTAGLTLTPGRKDTFYIFPGKSTQFCGGKLYYNRKTGRYWLKAGSVLAANVDDIPDCGIAGFIEINQKKKALLFKNGRYTLLKDVEIRSPSKAAWLICGYKRNGLDAWRTMTWSGEKRKEETLRQVLAHMEEKNHQRTSKR